MCACVCECVCMHVCRLGEVQEERGQRQKSRSEDVSTGHQRPSVGTVTLCVWEAGAIVHTRVSPGPLPR